jgi:hypothetical protein
MARPTEEGEEGYLFEKEGHESFLLTPRRVIMRAYRYGHHEGI